MPVHSLSLSLSLQVKIGSKCNCKFCCGVNSSLSLSAERTMSCVVVLVENNSQKYTSFWGTTSPNPLTNAPANPACVCPLFDVVCLIIYVLLPGNLSHPSMKPFNETTRSVIYINWKSIRSMNRNECHLRLFGNDGWWRGEEMADPREECIHFQILQMSDRTFKDHITRQNTLPSYLLLSRHI